MESQSATTWAGSLTTFLTTANILRLCGIWVAYRVCLAVFNVSPYHPLSRFPGPKLAAASFLYEFWFDFVRGGRYTWEIKQMHEKYGKSAEEFATKPSSPPLNIDTYALVFSKAS